MTNQEPISHFQTLLDEIGQAIQAAMLTRRRTFTKTIWALYFALVTFVFTIIIRILFGEFHFVESVLYFSLLPQSVALVIVILSLTVLSNRIGRKVFSKMGEVRDRLEDMYTDMNEHVHQLINSGSPRDGNINVIDILTAIGAIEREAIAVEGEDHTSRAEAARSIRRSYLHIYNSLLVVRSIARDLPIYESTSRATYGFTAICIMSAITHVCAGFVAKIPDLIGLSILGGLSSLSVIACYIVLSRRSSAEEFLDTVMARVEVPAAPLRTLPGQTGSALPPEVEYEELIDSTDPEPSDRQW